MFCFQCQETVGNAGCTVRGVCGKSGSTSNLQDLLIYVLKGVSVYGEELKRLGSTDRSPAKITYQGLFATITNANFDDARFIALIREALRQRGQLRSRFLALYKERAGKTSPEHCLKRPHGHRMTPPCSLGRLSPLAYWPLLTRMYVPCVNCSSSALRELPPMQTTPPFSVTVKMGSRTS